MKIKKTRMIVGILCIVLAFIIGVVGVPLVVNSMTASVNVVVATTDIKPGDALNSTNTAIVEMGREGLPEGYMSSLSSYTSNFLTKDEESKTLYSNKYISKNGFIMQDAVTDTSVDAESLMNIPAGKVAISFTLSGVASSFDNQFLAGDIVQFMCYKNASQTAIKTNDETVIKQNEEGEVTTNKKLSYVKLLSVNTEYGTEVTADDKETVKYTVATAIVTPEQAAEIVRLEHEGSIHLSLIYRGDAEKANAYVATQDAYLAKNVKGEK